MRPAARAGNHGQPSQVGMAATFQKPPRDIEGLNLNDECISLKEKLSRAGEQSVDIKDSHVFIYKKGYWQDIGSISIPGTAISALIKGGLFC